MQLCRLAEAIGDELADECATAEAEIACHHAQHAADGEAARIRAKRAHDALVLSLQELGRRYFAEAQATGGQVLRLCEQIATELIDDGATEGAQRQCRIAADEAADVARVLAEERAEQVWQRRHHVAVQKLSHD